MLIAWGCASLQTEPWQRGLGDERYEFVSNWPRSVPASWPPPLNGSRAATLGVTRIGASGSEPTQIGGRGYRLDVWQFGLPFRCLDWESRKVGQPEPYSKVMDAAWSVDEDAGGGGSLRRGIPHPWFSGIPGLHPWQPRLPLRPMPLGFATNVLLFAACFYGAVRGPQALRARLRERRGLCPSCAYDLSGSTSGGCPECGTRSRDGQREPPNDGPSALRAR